MDEGINNVIYMELLLGPKVANGTCGKTIIAGTIDRGSTVHGLGGQVKDAPPPFLNGRHFCRNTKKKMSSVITDRKCT
jgi:hypothetical protein